jgi:MoaA/NifB/PqqE/SkfB family radical SAM enzyme
MKFRFFQVEVSRNCNLSCVMCPTSRLPAEKMNMSPDVFERISNYFTKTELIHLQGWGEPLMHPEILRMIEIAKEHAKTGLTTNGTMLKRFAEDLVKMEVDYVAVSISGPKSHGSIRKGSSLETILKGIEAVNESKRKQGFSFPAINLTYLITRTNFEEIPDAFKLAVKLKAGFILTNLDYPFDEETYSLRVFDTKLSNKVEKIVRNIEKEAGKLGIPFKRPAFKSMEAAICDAFPDSAIVFSVYGDVFPCAYLNLPFYRIPRYFRGECVVIERPDFGNVMQKSLEEIWQSPFYKNFREKFEKRIDALKGINFLLPFGKLEIPDCCKGCCKLYGI